MSFYDPQGIRKNRKRYSTRKGQVIQAKLRDPPRCINPSLISTYGSYFAANPQYGLVPTPPKNYPYDIIGVVFSQPNSSTVNYLWSQFTIQTNFTNSSMQSLIKDFTGNVAVLSYIKVPGGFFFTSEGFVNNQTPKTIYISPPNRTYLTPPFVSHSITITTSINQFLVTFLFSNAVKPESSCGITSSLHGTTDDVVLDTWVFVPNSIYHI